MKTSLCDGWEFTERWSEAFLRGEGEGTPVRLPHTCRELPLHYIDSEDYQMVCGYRRTLTLPPEAAGRRVFLQFDGAAHIATVYVNGREAATHRCGYTAFRVELTGLADLTRPVSVAVRLDTTENPAVPPFGFLIDYLTYGGLYREAWLDVRAQSFLADVFVTTPALDTAEIRCTVDGPAQGLSLALSIRDETGKTLWQGTGAPGETVTAQVPGALPWDLERPVRYACAAVLSSPSGEELDRQEVLFGFRTAQFRRDGFYLNGKKTFLRGLNRHQSWPYVGYAAPEALQREDARILKEELSCTAVRTSHYPQSHYFLDECDKLGLLVFTELPGWQHIGDAAWKDQAVENVREMVLQYRNHPSIVLWGVRINESLDDDAFYARTNAIAHELDPSRQTSGVRYLEKSHLLEDVYAFNDFSHTGENAGARPKAAVTPDVDKALLISECNGHMFPTKPYDTWERRQEHALRHVRVQNAAMAGGEHAGCFGWCMFDYPTHKDFGSGDRVCYHGVMDAFRNPKLAAAVYASQGDGAPVLEVGSSMDIGDYPAGLVGKVYAFSNADRVALYRDGQFVGYLEKADWTALPHPPLVLDDTQKYLSAWGGASTVWRFDAEVDGRVVKQVTRAHSAALRLEVTPSHTELTEGDSYDMAAVRVRVLDGSGNPAPYAQLPVRFSLSGDAELVGPDTVTAEGGMCGAYLRTVGRTGRARLTVSTGQTPTVTVDFTVRAGAR